MKHTHTHTQTKKHKTPKKNKCKVEKKEEGNIKNSSEFLSVANFAGHNIDVRYRSMSQGKVLLHGVHIGISSVFPLVTTYL